MIFFNKIPALLGRILAQFLSPPLTIVVLPVIDVILGLGCLLHHRMCADQPVIKLSSLPDLADPNSDRECHLKSTS